MSRAFMFEKEDMFHCNIKDRDCPDANLRGGCDLARCRHDDDSAEPAGNIEIAGTAESPDTKK